MTASHPPATAVVDLDARRRRAGDALVDAAAPAQRLAAAGRARRRAALPWRHALRQRSTVGAP